MTAYGRLVARHRLPLLAGQRLSAMIRAAIPALRQAARAVPDFPQPWHDLVHRLTRWAVSTHERRHYTARFSGWIGLRHRRRHGAAAATGTRRRYALPARAHRL